jgi:hypothetical protein
MAWLPTERAEISADGSIFTDFTNFDLDQRPTHVGIFQRGALKLEVKLGMVEDLALCLSEMAHKADELE